MKLFNFQKFREYLRNRRKYDFNDCLRQLHQIKKFEHLERFAGWFGLKPGPESPETKRLRNFEAVIYSMTIEERTRPAIIDSSRKLRIAHGSGVSLSEVNELIKGLHNMREKFRF